MQRPDESQRSRGISYVPSLDDMTKKAKENKFKRAESNSKVCGWARRKKRLAEQEVSSTESAEEMIDASRGIFKSKEVI